MQSMQPIGLTSSRSHKSLKLNILHFTQNRWINLTLLLLLVSAGSESSGEMQSAWIFYSFWTLYGIILVQYSQFHRFTCVILVILFVPLPKNKAKGKYHHTKQENPFVLEEERDFPFLWVYKFSWNEWWLHQPGISERFTTDCFSDGLTDDLYAATGNTFSQTFTILIGPKPAVRADLEINVLNKAFRISE